MEAATPNAIAPITRILMSPPLIVMGLNPTLLARTFRGEKAYRRRTMMSSKIAFGKLPLGGGPTRKRTISKHASALMAAYEPTRPANSKASAQAAGRAPQAPGVPVDQPRSPARHTALSGPGGFRSAIIQSQRARRSGAFAAVRTFCTTHCRSSHNWNNGTQEREGAMNQKTDSSRCANAVRWKSRQLADRF